jgi:ribulose bisphosphate carboxylase small subunit
MAEPTWYVDCKYREEAQCDWEVFVDDEKMGDIVTVLHCLTKHPDTYQRLTGNDPSEKVVEYREAIEAFRSLL